MDGKGDKALLRRHFPLNKSADDTGGRRRRPETGTLQGPPDPHSNRILALGTATATVAMVPEAVVAGAAAGRGQRVEGGTQVGHDRRTAGAQ